MVRLLNIEKKKGKIPVLIDSRMDLLNFIDRDKTKIILVLSSVSKTLNNIIKRNNSDDVKDHRNVKNVLKSWSRFLDDKQHLYGSSKFMVKKK